MDNYHLSKAAELDLVSIYKWGIVMFGEKQADFYFDELYNRFDYIAKHSTQFPLVEGLTSNIRKSVFESHSIFFEVQNQSVFIKRIIRSLDVGLI